jgi:hypothetical protein
MFADERTRLALLPLDDPRWATYRGGYNRAPYDVVPPQREGTSSRFWDLVWADLHHQGDVGMDPSRRSSLGRLSFSERGRTDTPAEIRRPVGAPLLV